jgi:lipopolysaccharide/colanic/teichoic acid biosynthesis glycosyltransferase
MKKSAGRKFYRSFGKRIVDICLAVPLVVISIPILGVCSILIKADSKGPIFFNQERLGRNGKVFMLLKLRTMTNKLRMASEVFVGNPEVTRVGRFLRRFKIDELPQLFNVLKGDMSLVGPRPGLISQYIEYTDLAKKRLEVRPGLTGLSQIRGNIYLTWEDRWVYDAEYVNNISFVSDLRIMLKTVHVLIYGEKSLVEKQKSKSILNK